MKMSGCDGTAADDGNRNPPPAVVPCHCPAAARGGRTAMEVILMPETASCDIRQEVAITM